MIFRDTFQAKPLCSPLLVVNAFLTLKSHPVASPFQANGCVSLLSAQAFLSFALSLLQVGPHLGVFTSTVLTVTS